MDTRSYLFAMAAAGDELRLLGTRSEPLDVAWTVTAYEHYLSALQVLEPPGDLADSHRDIARGAQAMMAFLGDPAGQQKLSAGIRPTELHEDAQRAAEAFKRLQQNADELNLGLRFL